MNEYLNNWLPPWTGSEECQAGRLKFDMASWQPKLEDYVVEKPGATPGIRLNGAIKLQCLICGRDDKHVNVHMMCGTWLPQYCDDCALKGAKIMDQICAAQTENWNTRERLIAEWKELVNVK